MPIRSTAPTRGILDFAQGLRSFELDRRPPSGGLAPWIENYGEVRWALPPGTTYRQTNLSHAAFNVAIEPDGAWLYGVPGPTFVREIGGQGRVFGVKFHPGAFYGWVNWAEAIAAEPEFSRRSALTDTFLGGRGPRETGEGRPCARALIENPSLLRVEDAASFLGIAARSLQRIFLREVGVGPKEVLRRYRLMEAAERLLREPDLAGADLAASLGYADQAHFIRDFKAVTGVPPEAYRRRQDP